MTPYDSRPETEKHVEVVRTLIGMVVDDLRYRADYHDASKLEEPEKAVFDEYTAKLAAVEYGSLEYKEQLAGMSPALEHHYKANDHHPEHFPGQEAHETVCDDRTEYLPGGEITVCHVYCRDCGWVEKGDPDDTRDAAAAHERETYISGGVEAMNLMQLTEMLCDWIAAGRRHTDGGDIHRSIVQNAQRFGYCEEIEHLLHTTADAILALETA